MSYFDSADREGVAYDVEVAGVMYQTGNFENWESPGHDDPPSDDQCLDADYIVVHYTSERGDDFYITLIGPWDDYDQLLTDADLWWHGELY